MNIWDKKAETKFPQNQTQVNNFLWRATTTTPHNSEKVSTSLINLTDFFSWRDSLGQVCDGAGRFLVGVGLVGISTDVALEVGQLEQKVDDVLIRVRSVAAKSNQIRPVVVGNRTKALALNPNFQSNGPFKNISRRCRDWQIRTCCQFSSCSCWC